MNRTDYRMHFGRNVRELRRRCGLIQAKLAERLGVTEEYLGKIERGRASPSFPLILSLAATLQVRPRDLFTFTSDASPDDPVAQIKADLARAELALRENRHRLKNCLQFLSSLFYLELERADSENLRAVLRDMAARIQGMSLLDSCLAPPSELRMVNLAGRLRSVCEAISKVYPAPAVCAEYCCQDILVPPETAASCAMILAEFLTNMYKHAFPGRTEGLFRMTLAREGETLQMVLADNGVGLPNGEAPQPPGAMGLVLLRSYVEQKLGGNMTLDGAKGATLTVRFPAPACTPSRPTHPTPFLSTPTD